MCNIAVSAMRGWSLRKDRRGNDRRNERVADRSAEPGCAPVWGSRACVTHPCQALHRNLSKTFSGSGRRLSEALNTRRVVVCPCAHYTRKQFKSHGNGRPAGRCGLDAGVRPVPGPVKHALAQAKNEQRSPPYRRHASRSTRATISFARVACATTSHGLASSTVSIRRNQPGHSLCPSGNNTSKRLRSR